MLRATFAWCGLLTVISTIWWMVLSPEMAKGPVRTSLRLMVGSLGLTGLYRAYGNGVKLETPIVFDGWIDQTFAMTSVYGSAVASVVALFVYIQKRKWVR